MVYYGDWGLGIGDWGLGPIPIPNPQSPKTSKSKSYPGKFYFDLFLLLIFCMNYQILNNYFHILSYNQFDSDLKPIFINGVSIFLLEVISYNIRDCFRKNHKGFFTMPSILILATLMIIMQLCKDNNLMYLILPFLVVSKIILMLLYLKYMEKFKKPKGNFHHSKTQKHLLDITHLSVVLASFYTSYLEQNLFILSSIYYFLFIIYLKLI
jgi:hypothetical protein